MNDYLKLAHGKMNCKYHMHDPNCDLNLRKVENGNFKSFGINVILVPLQFYLKYGQNDICQLKHRKDMYKIGNDLEKTYLINTDNNNIMPNEVLMIVCAKKDDRDNDNNYNINGKIVPTENQKRPR